MTSIDEAAPVMTSAPTRPPMPTLQERVPGQVSRGGSSHSFGTEGPDLGDDQSPPDRGGVELKQRRYGALDDQQEGASFREVHEDVGEGEFGGKAQIGPWQAGWNVTNAIQVFVSLIEIFKKVLQHSLRVKCENVSGNVRGESPVRSVARRLVGRVRSGLRGLYLLLHRSPVGRMPVRRRRRSDSQQLQSGGRDVLGSTVGRACGLDGPNDRAVDDLHLVRGPLRRLTRIEFPRLGHG